MFSCTQCVVSAHSNKTSFNAKYQQYISSAHFN